MERQFGVYLSKTAQQRKEEVQETLRRAELDFKGDFGLATGGVAAFALHKVEELGAFKARVDRRIAEGRTSVPGRELDHAYNIRRLVAYLCPYSSKCVAGESSEVRGAKKVAGE